LVFVRSKIYYRVFLKDDICQVFLKGLISKGKKEMFFLKDEDIWEYSARNMHDRNPFLK